ncbi:MAG: DNA-directed RNA polymerase subunit omega [Firmicutes bacterium]|nr:DNA-directed RNA polymerase subunit omega [Bacillota bacterium]
MMIKPGITELSRCVDSRYTLVTMASKRARMIGEHTVEENGKFVTVKPVSIAANEIAEGKIGYVRSDSIKEAEQYEAEKEAAILQYSENSFEEEAVDTEEENVENADESAEENRKSNGFDFLNSPADE